MYLRRGLGSIPAVEGVLDAFPAGASDACSRTTVATVEVANLKTTLINERA